MNLILHIIYNPNSIYSLTTASGKRQDDYFNNFLNLNFSAQTATLWWALCTNLKYTVHFNQAVLNL